jgi:diguanylate cyclase (GGDEF)-like protein
MIDVDRFGLINKTYGHPVGDDVLKFVANTIKEITGSKGKCYRYGGEEIAIVLPNYTAEEAEALAERARCQICAAAFAEQSVHVSASFGVAQIPTHASTARELLKLADSALLDAKNRGRNLVRISGEEGPEARPRLSTRKRPHRRRD